MFIELKQVFSFQAFLSRKCIAPNLKPLYCQKFLSATVTLLLSLPYKREHGFNFLRHLCYIIQFRGFIALVLPLFTLFFHHCTHFIIK